jgi:hypothetical protein
MRIFSISLIVFVYEFLGNDLILSTCDFGKSSTCGLDLVLINFIRGFCSLEQRKHVFDMTVGGRNVYLFKIFNDLTLPTLTNLASLTIHEGSSNLITAFLANLAFEKDIVVESGLIEALDVELIGLPYVVLAELAVSEVLLDGVGANDAVALSRVGIFDYLGAFVANLAVLGNPVQQALLLVAV